MRLYGLFAFFCASAVLGQDASTDAEAQAALELLASMPSCGLSCLTTAIAASPCSATDIACSCSNDTITAQVELCVAQSCTVKNQLTTKNTTETLCQHPVRDQTNVVSYSGVIGCVIAVIAFLLRMVSKVSFPCESKKMRFINNLWWDDAVATFAMLEIIPLSSLSVVLADTGLGRDVWTLPFANIYKILKIYYFDEDLYLTALPAIKISMCLTYLRIFQSKKFRQAVYVVIALNVAYGIAFLLVSIFQCRPISCAWTHWDMEHDCHCNNINAQGWTSAAFNVILDIFTLGLPLPMLWKMTLNKRKKFLVLLMFSVGFFVTIVSILRLQVLIEFGASQNLTWDYRAVGYWSTIELHAAVVCACMPSIRNLIRRFQPRLMGSSLEHSAQLNQSGLSGKTAVSPGLPKVGPEVFVRRRDSDEEDFIPLQEQQSRRSHPNNGSDTIQRAAQQPPDDPYVRSQSGMSWFALNDSKEDTSVRARPVSPLDTHSQRF